MSIEKLPKKKDILNGKKVLHYMYYLPMSQAF